MIVYNHEYIYVEVKLSKGTKERNRRGRGKEREAGESLGTCPAYNMDLYKKLEINENLKNIFLT